MAGRKYNAQTLEVLEDTELEIDIPFARPPVRRFAVRLSGPEFNHLSPGQRTIISGYFSIRFGNRTLNPPYHSRYIEFFRGCRPGFGRHQLQDRLMELNIPLDPEGDVSIAQYCHGDPAAPDGPQRQLHPLPLEDAGIGLWHRSSFGKLYASFDVLGDGDLFAYRTQHGQIDIDLFYDHLGHTTTFRRGSSWTQVIQFEGTARKGHRLDELILVITTLMQRARYLTGMGICESNTSPEVTETAGTGEQATSEEDTAVGPRQRDSAGPHRRRAVRRRTE